jgi:hypothetical protein
VCTRLVKGNKCRAVRGVDEKNMPPPPSPPPSPEASFAPPASFSRSQISLKHTHQTRLVARGAALPLLLPVS